MNNTVSDRVSRIMKMNGWSAMNFFGRSGSKAHPTFNMAVAAAASVPSASTLTNALWIASLKKAFWRSRQHGGKVGSFDIKHVDNSQANKIVHQCIPGFHSEFRNTEEDL